MGGWILIATLCLTQYLPLMGWDFEDATENENPIQVDLPDVLDLPKISLDLRIVIDDDSDWAAVKDSGNGGSDEPYIIENRTIDAGGVSFNGIMISGTTLYFEVRNCTIYNAKNGIVLINVGTGTGKIHNNTIYDCLGASVGREGMGINLQQSDGMVVANNTVYDITAGSAAWTGNGIFCFQSDSNIIEGNVISGIRSVAAATGQGCGIYIAESNFNDIIDNTISDCSSESTASSYSGIGVYVLHGSDNNIVNNTIYEIGGGSGGYSGNGIVIFEAYTFQVQNNLVDRNTIFNITGHSNGEYAGNGVLIFGGSGRVLETTTVTNNLIYNIMGGTYQFGGNGIQGYSLTETTISDNTILNCSTTTSSTRSGSGILIYHTDHTTITNNVIDNCLGFKVYGGNGIFSAYEKYNTISFNNISNTVCGNGSSDYYYSGNGIQIHQSDDSQILYNRISGTYSGNMGHFSGNGIYLGYEYDFSSIIGNTVRDCIGISGWADCNGILGTFDFDCNMISDNDVGDEAIAILYREGPEYRNDNNAFKRNTANRIDIYYGDKNIIEDNTVNTIRTYSSTENQIVGNMKANGSHPDFTFFSDNKWTNYFLKITSPEADKTYSGCGGVRLTYKWQSFGYDLDWACYKFDGEWDSLPRPDGEIFIPWKADGEHTIQMWSNDTSASAQSYVSKPVTFSFEFDAITEIENLLDITHNTQEEGMGDPHALSYWDTGEGDGTAYSPYVIQNMNFMIPAESPVGTAGISIADTDAYFILKDCVISGGVGHYGISLSNVQNARIENVTVIGIPAAYDRLDLTASSYPIERGLYLDANCVNNSVEQSTFYRTLSAGIMVDGDSNTFSNNIIAPAQSNGIISSGNDNTFVNNDIAPFGGPDHDDFHFTEAEADGSFIGVVIDESGSGNTIEGNSIRNFPANGIKIAESTCENNVIVGNDFDSCATNISDSGTGTHFLKITTPLDGNYYTGNNPLDDGYYSGTEGFQDVDDESLPSNWIYSGTGTENVAEVIAEKEDLYDSQHKKVLHCYTGQGADPTINVSKTFVANYSSGTIEFWVLKEGNETGLANFTFYGTGGGELFTIMLDSETFNESITASGQEFHDDFWYRLSVDFVDTGTYAGLSDHQYKFRIYNYSGDALLYESDPVDFRNTGNLTGFSIFAQGGGTNDLSLYLDAFGYSWSPDYSLWNNAYEGMLIAQSVQLDYKTWEWVGFSLNDESMILLPSFGDVVIPLPNSLGEQTLQLFANDSSDYQTNSPVVHFSYYFNRKLNIVSHYENDELVATNTILTGGGVLKMDPATPLIINVTYSTMKSESPMNTNASLYYRINQDSWVEGLILVSAKIFLLKELFPVFSSSG